MVDDDDLRKIECMFNRVMNLIICRCCDLAIPVEYIQAHFRGKHGINCLEELVNSIILNYQPRIVAAVEEFKNTILELDLLVNGIPIKRGFRCLICRHCTRLKDSMTRHFRTIHEGENIKEQTEGNIEIQLLFGGRFRKWFPIKEPGAESMKEQNDDAWTIVQSILAVEKRRTMKNSVHYRPEECNAFRKNIDR